MSTKDSLLQNENWLINKNIVQKAIKIQKKKCEQKFELEKKRYESIINEKQEMLEMLKKKEDEAAEKQKVVSFITILHFCYAFKINKKFSFNC